MKIACLLATCVTACLLIFAGSAVGADVVESETFEGPGKLPDIEEFKLIHADSMTLTRQKDKPQVFQGAVDIILVDKEGNESRIEAEKLTIYYDQEIKKVQRMEAEGKVRIARQGSMATTDLAVYRGEQNVIELLIDPHVKDSRGELTANKITLFLDSDRVVAEGNVRGVVYPEAFEEEKTK
jgi:lipopolysaccharide transport protein LptA